MSHAILLLSYCYCECPSKNPHSLHFVLFWEILFWNIYLVTKNPKQHNTKYFCRMFSNVSTAYRGTGWNGWMAAGQWSWMGGRVRTPLQQPRCPHNGPCTLVGHREDQSAVGVILGPYHIISALHWCHCSSCNFVGSAKYSPQKQIS